jgi:undecaprenyl-diphosphatase
VHHRVGALNPLFKGLSLVGTVGLIWIVIALGLGIAWRRYGLIAMTALAVAAADLSATALKHVFDVERPSSRYATPKPLVHAPTDPSFPSGHSATSFAAATILTLAVPRLAPAWFTLAAAIAFSRIYVGVHYPLDIVGGALLGAAIALLMREASRRLSRARRPAG